MTTQAVRLYKGRVVQRWDHEPTEYRQVIRGRASGPLRGVVSAKYSATSIYSVGAGTLNVVGEMVDPARYTRGAEIAMQDGSQCTLTFAFTAKTLDQVKTERRSAINANRETVIASGVAYDGHTYDTDERSRANLAATIAEINSQELLPPGFAWRTPDDINVSMSISQVRALGSVMFAHVNQAYAASWGLKAQIDAAQTIDDVLAVVW